MHRSGRRKVSVVLSVSVRTSLALALALALELELELLEGNVHQFQSIPEKQQPDNLEVLPGVSTQHTTVFIRCEGQKDSKCFCIFEMAFYDLPQKKRSNLQDKTNARRRQSSLFAKSPHLPLYDVPQQIYQLKNHPLSSLDNSDHVSKSCGFIKSFQDVLANTLALKYFTEFMESEDAIELIKFCVDAHNFKVSAQNVTKCLSELSNAPNKDKNELTEMQNEAEDEEPFHHPASPSCDSSDSGVNFASNELPTDHNKNLSPKDLVILNQSKEALSIYQTYIAPQSSLEISLPPELKTSIINKICTEEGQVDTRCFDEALQIVTTKILSQYFKKFLKSKFYTKHVLDVLTQESGRSVGIHDILEDETLLGLFSEFLDRLDGGNHRFVLDFCIRAKNYKQATQDKLLSLKTSEVSRGDYWVPIQAEAREIFHIFIAEDACSSLGFDTAMRQRIDDLVYNNTSKVDASIFNEPLNLVEQAVEVKYLQKFLSSIIFRDYVSQLRSDVEIPDVRISKSESFQSLNTLDSVDTGRILRDGSGKKSFDRTCSSSVDLDSQCIWKRRHTSLTNVGFVDSMGRYFRTYDPIPDNISSNTSSTMTRKISRAMKRMMTSSETVDKEEMAWQVCHLIISQVLSRPSATAEEQFESFTLDV